MQLRLTKCILSFSIGKADCSCHSWIELGRYKYHTCISFSLFSFISASSLLSFDPFIGQMYYQHFTFISFFLLSLSLSLSGTSGKREGIFIPTSHNLLQLWRFLACPSSLLQWVKWITDMDERERERERERKRGEKEQKKRQEPTDWRWEKQRYTASTAATAVN